MARIKAELVRFKWALGTHTCCMNRVVQRYIICTCIYDVHRMGTIHTCIRLYIGLGIFELYIFTNKQNVNPAYQENLNENHPV